MTVLDPSATSQLSGGEPKTPWLSTRWTFCFLAFLGFFNAFSTRVTLSVAIVAMVNGTAAPSSHANSTSDDVCPVTDTSKSYESLNDPMVNGGFDWDASQQGLILGSFFYGYVCTQIFGGWAAQKYGAKYPFGWAILVSGALSLLIPVAANWRYQALITVRVLQGLFQGVIFPSMHTMMGQWAPPSERSRMVSIVYTGSEFGSITALGLSGVLAEHLGWESAFYFFGATSILWYVLWQFFAFDSPNNHPRITEAERLYIVNSIGTTDAADTSPFPWRRAVTSLPFWALCVAYFGHNWGFYTLLTNIPTYLSKILHFSLETNGFLSALPYVVSAIVMIVSGFFADLLTHRRVLSTTAVRRVFHFTGQLLPSIFLVALGYVGCDVPAAVALLTLAIGLDGLSMSGYQVNAVDLSPTHAGMLMGLSNTFGSIPGMLGPYVVGYLTNGPLGQTISQWRVVFFISAGIYMATATFFAVFVSGQLASWEKPKGKARTEEKEVDRMLVAESAIR
ncbi:Sialin [Hypsibius exemplaris]|uniref:Sialin n=1 Tax=Hypsibius exemplaris TaxID=2072580 RepID=A0A1W0WGY5_HYPEX|nr:Sialin [Hypsibius exemplaris]